LLFGNKLSCDLTIRYYVFNLPINLIVSIKYNIVVLTTNTHKHTMSNPLEESLGFNLTRVATLFRRELLNALSEFDMTPEQWQIMVSLWTQSKPLSQKDIVNITLKDKHSISRIVSRLEKNGWITKLQDPHDARASLIQQTKKGRELKALAPPQLIKHFASITGKLSNDEHRQLLQTLKKLREILGDDYV